jgi:hypothetical protein
MQLFEFGDDDTREIIWGSIAILGISGLPGPAHGNVWISVRNSSYK